MLSADSLIQSRILDRCSVMVLIWFALIEFSTEDVEIECKKTKRKKEGMMVKKMHDEQISLMLQEEKQFFYIT